MTPTPNSSLTVQDPKPRAKPLDIANFEKIETLIGTVFKVTPRTESVSVPMKDDLGHVYRYESQSVQTGWTIEQTQKPPIGFLESLRRPAAPGYITAHLTRLEAHLKHTRGPAAFTVICEDIDRDLAGISEWAVVKACETFRKSGKPWFPDTPDFQTEARKWDEFTKTLSGSGQPVAKKPEVALVHRQYDERTPEMKTRVADMMHGKGFHNGHEARMADGCRKCAEVIKNRKENANA